MTDKFTIAYVGLGIMGAPAAGHLLAAGHRLRVWARRPEAMEALVARGAAACASAAEAADGADFAFTNVLDTPDVEEVVLGPAGYVQKLLPGSVVIDMSTIAPQAARDLAAALWRRDARACPGWRAARRRGAASRAGSRGGRGTGAGPASQIGAAAELRGAQLRNRTT